MGVRLDNFEVLEIATIFEGFKRIEKRLDIAVKVTMKDHFGTGRKLEALSERLKGSFETR